MGTINKALVRSRKNKAFACIQEQRFQEARDLYTEISRIDKQDAEVWLMLGAVNGQLGLYDEAVSCCRKAAALRPDYVEAHYNLAQAYMHLFRPAEAAAAYRQVLRWQPEHLDALNNLGYALEKLGNYQEALSCYRNAVKIRPNFAEAYCNLGNLLLNLGQGADGEGMQFLRLAIQLKPQYTKTYKYLGLALDGAGRTDEALACFDKILAAEPGNPEIVACKALAYEKRREYEKAYDLLRPHLESGTEDINILQAFAPISRHVNRRDEALSLLANALSEGRVKQDEALAVNFSLGKLYDEKGNYDLAFRHFEQANALKRVTYDPENTMRQFDEMMAFFSREFLARQPHAQHGSDRPVFIVGMPRSGTTLVEQILASHPQVFGAGELTNIAEIANNLSARLNTNLDYPRSLLRLTQEPTESLARQYLDLLQKLSPDAARVTDKMPHNFQYLGLIELLFPRAHIIHCQRDPMDTCLSIYSYDFNAMHGYATKLEWLGQYYRKYEALMAHWKKVLTIPMMEISYEELVADQERLIRKMIEFCGLEWDDRCLRFHENKRSVNTPSYDQVRRPIYRKSVARWKHYEQHLMPLRQALDAYSTDNSQSPN